MQKSVSNDILDGIIALNGHIESLLTTIDSQTDLDKDKIDKDTLGAAVLEAFVASNMRVLAAEATVAFISKKGDKIPDEDIENMNNFVLNLLKSTQQAYKMISVMDTIKKEYDLDITFESDDSADIFTRLNKEYFPSITADN